MRGIIWIALLPFTGQLLAKAVAEEFVANYSRAWQSSAHVLTSKSADDVIVQAKLSSQGVSNHLVNALIDHVLISFFKSVHRQDLDNITIGKPVTGDIFPSSASHPQQFRGQAALGHRNWLSRLRPHLGLNRIRDHVTVLHATAQAPPKIDTPRLSGHRKGFTSKLKDARASMEQDEEVSSLMAALRGANLNNDDKAKEGLEMRFVNLERSEEDLPRRYDPIALKEYFSKQPVKVLERALQVSSAASGFIAKLALDKLQNRSNDPAIQTKRAADLRDLVTSLGPFFIKIGQALSIRPDILPPKSMQELQKLCDKVPPFDSKVAMKMLTDELGAPPEEIFSELSPEPVAAASLGQVYKGRLRSTGEEVAVKVQRPFVLGTVSLDLYLMRQLGLWLRSFPALVERTDLVALVDEFAGRFYDELDYRLECKNGIRIAEHMASLPKVVIPKCYPEYTSRRVHTAEWVEGEKLAQSNADDVLDLVNVGVVAYLTQLLGEGFFHADPHPGNMIRTPDGRLCILDFGLMTELTDNQKYGMFEAIVHLINRDYKEIGDDFKNLDFIPREVDVEPIVPALTNVFNAALAGGGAKNINFNDLAADLAEITFEYPFRIPPYFALVIRAIGVLEGIALVGNPEFAIVDEAYPYISQRLLTDESPRLRAALRYMIYGRDGVFDSERLIDMLGAFENFDVVRRRAGGISYGGPESSSEAARMSTALAFFFSQEGRFFRKFLLDETVLGVDVLSRNALIRLPELLPGPAGEAMKTARVFVPGLLRDLVPDLTPAEEKTLRSTTALLNFLFDRDDLASPATLEIVTSPRESLSQAAETAQRLRPVVQEYSGAMREFGLEVVSRLAELYTKRALVYTFGPAEPKRSAPKLGSPAQFQSQVVVAREQDSQPTAIVRAGSWQQREFAPRVLETAERVKLDINSILRVEPNWDDYTKDLTLIDPKGTRLGLAKVQQLLGIVRQFIGVFIEKEVVDIGTQFLDTSEPLMTASGTIALTGCGLPIPFAGSFNLQVAGACTIHFNDQGKVETVDVDSWSFNGRPIELPKLDSMEAENLSPQDTVKLLQWTRKAIFGEAVQQSTSIVPVEKTSIPMKL